MNYPEHGFLFSRARAPLVQVSEVLCTSHGRFHEVLCVVEEDVEELGVRVARWVRDTLERHG